MFLVTIVASDKSDKKYITTIETWIDRSYSDEKGCSGYEEKQENAKVILKKAYPKEVMTSSEIFVASGVKINAVNYLTFC